MADSDTRHGGSSPEGTVHKHTEREFPGQEEARAREHRDKVRAGVRAPSLRARRPPEGRLRQFLYGASLPFHIGGALLGDPVARKQYIRVGFLQSIAALALALSCMTSGTEAAESASKRRSRDEAQAAQVEKFATAFAERQAKKAEAKSARRLIALEEKTQARLKALDARLANRELAAAGAALGEAESDTAPSPTDSAPTPDDSEARTDGPNAAPEAPKPQEGTSQAAAASAARLEKSIRDLEAAAQGADAGVSLPEAIAALVLETTRGLDLEEGDSATASDAEQGAPTDSPPSKADAPAKSSWAVKGFSVWSIAFWAALFAALQLAQWVIIALSRDYHDAISRQASLLTGLEPEEEDVPPRVRVNFVWLRKKLRRRWRAFLLLMVGVPALFVLAVPFMCASRTVFYALFTAWSMWWWVVFTAAKSSRAWEPAMGASRPPWFLRLWTFITTRVPGLRWGTLQRYGASWGRRTEEVFAPISSTERHPWVFAGLALVRFLGSFPPMKFFVRPLIPVASAHLLVADVEAAKEALAAQGQDEPPSTGVPKPADVW